MTKARFFSSLVSGVFLIQAIAAAQTAKFEPISEPEKQVILKQLEHQPLPGHGVLDLLQTKQIFILTGRSAPPLTIVPLVWEQAAGDVSYTGCGIDLLQPGMATQFVATVGEDDHGRTLGERVQCGHLEAIGTMTDPGSRPRLILVYFGYYRDTHVTFKHILSWNEKTRHYEVDTDPPNYRDERYPVETIAEIRKELSSSSPSNPRTGVAR